MIIKCVIACHNANGEPDFYFCKVECSQSDYELGIHYDMAIEEAVDNGYELPFVAFDENEKPNWLFDHFVWESATIVKKV